MKTIKTNSFLEAFACILIAIPLVSYLLAVVTLWIGFPINGFILPLSIVLVLGWEWIRKSQERLSWQVALSVLLTMAITLLLSSVIYDRSFDGSWYHSATILSLVEGWNPYYQSVSGINQSHTALWVEHYARGVEMLSATVVACIGNLEAGKAVNMWLVIASIIYIFLFLRYTLPHLNRYVRVWLALVASLNPVVVNQLCTYYVDWTLYTVLVISLINLYLFFVQNKRWAMGIELLLLFFVPSIKFNIFFWIVLWSAVAFFGGLIKCKYSHPYRLTIVVAIVLLAGTTIGAYNPYITNWVEHETPMYPLVGEGAKDIMSDNTPLYVKDKSRVESVVLSLIANPTDGDEVDCHIGGFGIYFFESILFACLLFVCTRPSRRQWGYLAVAAGLFLSLFVFPSGWWARYVAFFYLFPFVLMYYAEREGLNLWWQKALHLLILALLSCDIAICLSGAIEKNIEYRHRVEQLLTAMEQMEDEVELYTENYAFLNQLKKHGISYRMIDRDYKEQMILSTTIYWDYKFDIEGD